MRRRGQSTAIDQVIAVARRDFAVQWSYQFQFFLQFAGIIFPLATFFFISRLVGDAEELGAYQGQYFGFVLVGLLVVSAMTVGLQTFSRTISAEQNGGTLEVLLATPSRLSAVLGGAFIFPMTVAGIQGALFVAIAAAIFGARFSLSGLLIAVPVLLLTVGAFCAFGIASAALIVLTKRGDLLSPLIANVTALLAGAVFPVALLPAPLEALARAIPAFYGLNALRALLLGSARAGDVITEVLILVAFAIVLLPLSLWLFSRAMRIARVTGTLGNY